MKRVWLWIKAISHWLAQPWLVWVSVAVLLCVMLVASWLPGRLEARVRYCGLLLELIGVVTVVYNLREKRRLFKQPSLYDHLRSWLRCRPRWGVEPRTILTADSLSISLSGKARLSSWRVMSSQASAEARLSALEANVETLRTQQAETTKHLEQEITNMIETVNSERRTRESAIGKIRTRLETFGAGSLHLEMVGLVWLICGMVASSISSEIAGALTWLLCWP
jgi:hypothetical protein